MALSEKTRAKMYDYFANTELGEEATSEMIASFTIPDLSTLVTKDHLDARLLEARLELREAIVSTRDEMHAEFTHVHSELALLRQDMADGDSSLRDEMRSEFASVRSELATGLTDVRSELATGLTSVRSELTTGLTDVRSEMHANFIQLIVLMLTLNGILAGLIVTLR